MIEQYYNRKTVTFSKKYATILLVAQYKAESGHFPEVISSAFT